MKKILIITLTLIAFNTANAETPTATATKEATPATTVKAVEVKETNDATAVGAPDNSAKFVGTNDLNLYILRQGVKKA